MCEFPLSFTSTQKYQVFCRTASLRCIFRHLQISSVSGSISAFFKCFLHSTKDQNDALYLTSFLNLIVVSSTFSSICEKKKA